MIAIIDYGLGNLRSVEGAVKKLEHPCLVSRKEDDLRSADKLILPGVGAFGDGMKNLRDMGLDRLLTELVRSEKKPILGICLGSQLMTRRSEEFGSHEGLGWIDAEVTRLRPGDKNLRIPHVGWNDLRQVKEDVIFDGIPGEALFYYVHSYRISCKDSDIVIGECEYGETFTAAYHDGNIFATQFHPEKSQYWGLRMLRNFLEKVPNVKKTVSHSLNDQ